MRAFIAILAMVLCAGSAIAQGLVGMEKQILPMTKENWIAFRNYDGKQLIYFTHLVVYRCGLSEIRYSFNSHALDSRLDMPDCDLQRPNEIPSDYLPFLSLPLGTAKSMTVQIVYSDGEESDAMTFAPCDIADDGTCATLVE